MNLYFYSILAHRQWARNLVALIKVGATSKHNLKVNIYALDGGEWQI